MAQFLNLLAWFLLGCILHSFLVWFGGLHSVLLNLTISFYVFLALAWAAAWVCDDAIIAKTGLSPMILYGSLLAFAITAILGAAITWMLQVNA